MSDALEKKFQNHIAKFLNKEHKFGYLTQAEITDTEYYFAEDHLYAFLKATQPETLERMEVDYGNDTRDEIFKALREEVERRPLWSIIKTGLTVRGNEFKLYFPKPRSSDSVSNELYDENRITFIPELVIKGAKRPDFGIFLNGLPIVTIELKHEKNQNVHDAVQQYVDRDHSDRIFQLPFLQIAADTADVQVATDPSSENNFRWFNTGLTNSPITEGEYPVEFLYREVLSKESLLEALNFYLVYVPKKDATEDEPERPAFTIYPRYHQKRCVEKIADETQSHFTEHGNVGRKFLVNHSAGSGKTLTMCWLADRLHSLYKPGTSDKMVDMIFLITDRKALHKNVKEDMEKFAHLSDIVRFAKRSGDLARFLKNRDQIIVTTQQKFHYILKKIAGESGLEDLRVAFLIDEAHRSQGGKMSGSRDMPFKGSYDVVSESGALLVAEPTRTYLVAEEAKRPTVSAEIHSSEQPDAEDAQDREDPEDKIAKAIKQHNLNQLYVAFTATPSAATVQLFNRPFDTYSEAEAIAEGYIVDVAQSIISYKTLYNLKCPIVPLPDEEKLYPPGVISKALKNVAFQDPELIQYKSEVMLRIFEEEIMPLVGGRSKAMIVTTSRIAGWEYYKIIKKKLEDRGVDYKALYAFTDFIDPKTNKLITEYELNGLTADEQIEGVFDTEPYRLLIVASKFQTGFDQPLLAGMFLDKAVADRSAVQTISRLNRCYTGKDCVVVVDFTNNAKKILKAFNKYRHGSPHDPDEPTPEKCTDLYEEILNLGVFNQEDAPQLIELIKKNDDAASQTMVNELRIRFREAITDSDERKSYVYLLARFTKVFHFLSSFFSYDDKVVEFVAFCEYVGPQLMKSGSVSELMKQVRATIVEKAAVQFEGEFNMPAGLKKPKPSKGGGGGGAIKKVSVQDMIAKLRETYEISDEEALHIREVSEEKISDESIQQTVVAHKTDESFLEDVFKGQINEEIQDAYTIRALYEQLADPKYTDRGAIFDIMAYTVIQKGLELAESA